MKFYGCISQKAAEEWMRIIDESCEQIDDEDPPIFPKAKKP